MRRMLLLGVTVLSLSVAERGTGGAVPDDKEGAWLTDVAAARRLARASGKPIFAVLQCHH